MRLYESYKVILVEGQVQSCIAKFGQELFSPQFGGDEPNTNVESNYLELIHDFSGGEFGQMINNDFINMAKNLKTCVSAYPEVLHPSGDAFRGTKTTLNALMKSFKHIKNNIRSGQSFEMTYAAKTPIQSWSNSENVATDEFGSSGPSLLLLLEKFEKAKQANMVKEFVNEVVQHHMDTKVPVILRYTTNPNDFIFKGRYFTYLSKFEEDEILRVDNRPIKVMAKIHPRELSAKIFDLLEAIRTN